MSRTCREGWRPQAIAKPLKRLWKEDRQKNNRVTIFAAFVDATLKFLRRFYTLNVGFWRRIYLQTSGSGKMWQMGHGTCFFWLLVDINYGYIKLFPMALGKLAGTSTPARSDCKASIVGLQEIYFGNRDQQSCKTSPIVISDRTLHLVVNTPALANHIFASWERRETGFY